jgi:Asp-tRNA(Asn)/Glu-tRNA(Gln) amidotransferase A subunit family amidase
MDATAILEKLQSGKLDAQKLISDSLSKIETGASSLHAATEILKHDAEEQVKNIPQGSVTGLPISIKECYAIAGKKITSGSKRMKPIQCKEDAFTVAKLKKAGAIVVARGNTSEFLLGRETDNLVFGTTNNAINPSLTAGGSSGGDAVLVANQSVAFAIGTDIGGSCRIPAAFNGIVGFKPASGQIDKKGIFPEAGSTFIESMNSPGILCRSVRDARMVYNIIGTKDLHQSNDISSSQIFSSSDFRVKITDNSISEALNHSMNFFQSHCSVKDIPIPESGKLYPLFATLMCAGFTDKIYEWSVTEKGEHLSFLGEFFRRLSGKQTISNELFSMLLPFNVLKPSSSKLKKVIKEVEMLREKYHAVLGNGILVLPTMGILAPLHKKFIPQYNKPGVIEILTPVSFCNILNLSCVTIPAYKFQKNINTNPPAIQLVTAPGNEMQLLNAAEQLEKELTTG